MREGLGLTLYRSLQLRTNTGVPSAVPHPKQKSGAGKGTNRTRAFPVLTNWERTGWVPFGDWLTASSRVLAAVEEVSELSRGCRTVLPAHGHLVGQLQVVSLRLVPGTPGGLHRISNLSRGPWRAGGRGQRV